MDIGYQQKEIFYHVAPSREAAMQSPYMETFTKHNKDVLLLYSGIDEFVMSNLKVHTYPPAIMMRSKTYPSTASFLIMPNIKRHFSP